MATTSGTAERTPSLLPAGLTAPLGGPSGRRLRPSGGGPLARLAPVVLLLALPLSVAALRQAGCLAAGWKGRTPVWRQCASPLVESVQVADLGRGITAWLTGSVRLDDPVLSGAVTSLLAGLAPGRGTAEQRWFLVLWMALTAAVLAGLVVVVGTVRSHPHADPVALALSPVLALTVLLSADLVPVALAVVAVWAWSRGRTTLAGVLAGLALLAGPTSAVVLLALALVPPGEEEPAAWRGGGEPASEGAASRKTASWDPAPWEPGSWEPGSPEAGSSAGGAVLRLVGTAAAVAVGVAVVVALFDTGTLTRPWTAWLDAGAGPGSPWYLFTLAGRPVAPTVVAVIAALGWVLAAVLVVLLSRRRPRPTVSAVALVGIATVLVTGAAFPASSALWLVPFVALVGIGWRDHLVWAGAEVVQAVALFGYLISRTDPSHGLPPGWYALALSLRLVAVAWIAHRAWVSASWGDAVPAGTLWRLPSSRPVENSAGGVGSNAYPPVTERP